MSKKNVFINPCLLILSAVIPNFSWSFLSEFYSKTFSIVSDTSLLVGYETLSEYILGYVISYVFLITLLYTAFGKGKKYWWMGILLIPSLLFVILVDLSHIWFYILVGLVGWVLGFGIYKLIGNRNLDT